MQPDGSSDKLYLRESTRANIGIEAANEYRQRGRTSAFTQHLDRRFRAAYQRDTRRRAHTARQVLAPQLGRLSLDGLTGVLGIF